LHFFIIQSKKDEYFLRGTEFILSALLSPLSKRKTRKLTKFFHDKRIEFHRHIYLIQLLNEKNKETCAYIPFRSSPDEPNKPLYRQKSSQAKGGTNFIA